MTEGRWEGWWGGRRAVVGAGLGFLLGVMVRLLGFWSTMLVLLLAGVGYLIGWSMERADRESPGEPPL